MSLLEGSTPLVPADRLSERVGADVWLKVEGANPTGSFKDRGMTCAVSAAVRDGAEAVICASTGNTAASAAAYAGRAGLTGAVIVPEGKIATGKLAQALMHGARVIALRGNFDAALKLVRELVQRHPIALVNSVNPYRLEGQKTASFEIVDEIGEIDALCIPVGNAGNITAYWKGFTEAGAARPRMLGYQAEGAAPLVHGAPVENPETVASAIRIGNPARWEEAMEAMTASHGDIRAVSDAEILDAYRWLAAHEGVFCEPASAAGRRGAAAQRRRGREPDRLRAHRPRAQGPAGRARARRLGRALRARDRRGREGGPRAVRRRRRIRVPASSANLGPGFDVLAAALALHIEVEVVETGHFAVVTDLAIARDRRNLVVRGFAHLASPDDFEFRITSDVPLSGGLGTSAAAYVAGLLAADSIFELDADVLTLATELEGHPDNVAAALLGGVVLCADGEATRFDPPPGLEAVLVVPHRSRADRQGARRAARRGADGRRGVQRRPRVAARARARAGPARPRRPRARRPPAPAAPRRAVPRVDGARGPRAPSSARSAPSISGAGPTVLVWSQYDATAGVVERLRARGGGLGRGDARPVRAAGRGRAGV